MKRLLLLIFVCACAHFASAQKNIKTTPKESEVVLPKDSVTGKVTYQGIIKVDSLPKKELYLRAKDWVVRTLKSSDNNINIDDKDYNSLTSTGNILLPDIGNRMSYLFTERHLNFKLTIYFKDGRVKYLMENMVHSCMKTMKFPVGPYTNSI